MNRYIGTPLMLYDFSHQSCNTSFVNIPFNIRHLYCVHDVCMLYVTLLYSSKDDEVNLLYQNNQKLKAIVFGKLNQKIIDRKMRQAFSLWHRHGMFFLCI